MKKHRFAARARVIVGSALAVGMLLFPGPSSGQTAGPVPRPRSRRRACRLAQGTAGRLRTAPPVGPGPGQRAEGRRPNARPGGSQGDQRGDRTKPPGGQSAVDRRSGGGPAQLLQGGFDLRLVSWGDGSGVPTSGKKLVIVGIDNHDLLHIRMFDAGGKSVVDTDETRLSTQAVAIATLKLQLTGLKPPQVPTRADEGPGDEEGDINRRSNVSRLSATATPGPAPSTSQDFADHSIEIGPGRRLISESRPLDRAGRRVMRPTRPRSSWTRTCGSCGPRC